MHRSILTRYGVPAYSCEGLGDLPRMRILPGLELEIEESLP